MVLSPLSRQYFRYSLSPLSLRFHSFLSFLSFYFLASPSFQLTSLSSPVHRWRSCSVPLSVNLCCVPSIPSFGRDIPWHSTWAMAFTMDNVKKQGSSMPQSEEFASSNTWGDEKEGKRERDGEGKSRRKVCEWKKKGARPIENDCQGD